jgi:hypothetical protein
MSPAWQTSDAAGPGSPSLSPCGPKKKAGCQMSKYIAIIASLKAILITASVAVARGDMLPVILISVLFNLAQLGVRPGSAEPQDTIVVSRSHDEGR